MANLIQIKRSLTTAVPGSLANGELAYTANGDVLYIGSNGGVVAIGGKRAPGTLTANQALVANATSGIDKVIVANLQPDYIYANGASGTTGQILTSNSTGGVYWGASPSGSLEGLSDTSITSPTDGALLLYDTGTSAWRDATMSGDATINDTGALTLATTGVGAASYGDANTVATFTVDAKGRLTAAGSADINHDTLLNFSADEHVAHSGVTLTAGSGLTGGGTIAASRTFNVGAGVGVTVNADDVAVNPGNGITANSTGTHVNVSGDSSLVANSTGLFVVDSTLSIATSQLTGDITLGTQTSGNYVATVSGGNGLTGSGTGEGSTPTLAVGAGNGITVNADDVEVNVSGDSSLVANSTGLFIDDSTLSIATSQLTGDVALGTQTSGNYVATVSGGNGLTGSGTGEGSTPTLAVGSGNGISVSADAVAVTGSSTITVNATGVHVNPVLSLTDLTLSGNLDVNGTLTTIDTQNLSVNDSIIELARNNAADSLDIGFYGTYNDGTERYTGLIWDTSSDVFELFANTTAEPTTTVDTGGTGYTTASLKAYLQSGGLVSNSSVVNITANSSLSVAIAANTLSLSSVSDQDILVGNSTGGLVSLGLGTSGYVLQSNGTALVYDTLDGGTF